MVEAQRHAQVFADGDVPIYHAWFLRDATHCHVERVVIEGNCPAAAVSEHSHRGEANRPAIALLEPRIAASRPPEDGPYPFENRHRDAHEPLFRLEALPLRLHRRNLGRPNLPRDLTNIFSVCPTN